MKKIKSEAGSITMVVFATVTFLLIILGTIYTTVTLKHKSQIVELEELKKAYDGDMAEIAEERMSKEITIINSDGRKIKLADAGDYYGRDVVYNGQTYQLFLVDTEGKYSNGEPRVWLQYKGYVDGVKLSDHYETTGISTANSILWQVNPDLDSKYGSTIRGLGSWNNNIKGVAYLCNTSNWNSTYVKSTDITAGAFAIGGVSAEMFCDSYNQARGVTSGVRLFDAKAFNKNSNYGYFYKPKNTEITNTNHYEGNYAAYTDYANNEILSSEYRGMYRISSKYPWLASPSAGGTSGVCSVNGTNGGLSNYSTDNAYVLRPAVSLPASIKIYLEENEEQGNGGLHTDPAANGR